MENVSEDSYLEKISDAIVVVPNSIQRKVHYSKEIGDGRLTIYTPKLNVYVSGYMSESSRINSLIDKKVIFIPLQTNLDRTAYENYRVRTKQIPLEFEVKKTDGGVEKTVRRIRAEIYNPFTEKSAKRVSRFVRRCVYPNSFIK